MNKVFKVILPSVVVLVLGISSMTIASGCEEDAKCDKCTSAADCTDGFQCFLFSDGVKRCAESIGDKCPM